jgi:hypothetical protein
MEEEIKLSRRYLDELIDFESKKLVGKCLKRFEIIEDKSVLKSNIKELIYEEMREFRDLILAYQNGYEVSIYKFTNKKT